MAEENKAAESKFGTDMAEAEQEYIAQFDPSSENYHSKNIIGAQVVVPIGGARVPDSMPSEFSDAPPAEEYVPTPAYQEISDLRASLNELKKDLSKICPCIESKLRAQASENQEKIALTTDLENAKIAVLLEKLPHYLARIAPHIGLLKFDYEALLAEVQVKSVVEYDNKEDYADFMLNLKHGCSQIFLDMKAMLDKLKQVKANKE